MQRKQLITLVTLTILILGATHLNTSAAEINMPERVEVESSLSAQEGNDIYFTTSPENGVIDHEFQSDGSSLTLYETNGRNRTMVNSYNPFIGFTASNPMALYQASNGSAQNLDLQYSATFYDLTGDSEDISQIENTVLLQGEQSAFRFEGAAGDPLIVDMKFKAQSNTEDIDVKLITPSGEIHDYSDTYLNQFNTFVHEFIPLVPTESGVYTLYLSPLDRDLILESVRVLTDVYTESVSSGYTDHIKGTETWSQFFEIEADSDSNSTGPSVMSLNSQQIIDQALDAYQLPYDLLGNMRLNYFTNGTGPFGDLMPATVINNGNYPVYVSITAIPPDEDNQFIRGEKERLGLDEGYDVDYAFWSEVFDVDEFTLNEPVLIEDYDQPNSNYFWFETTRTNLVGLNSTASSNAYLLELDTLETYILASDNNNILNTQSSDIVELPVGRYLIYLEGSPNTEARVSTFAAQNLAQGEKSNFFFNLDTPVFFKLQANQPVKEYFNFTYLDAKNESVSMDFSLYDGDGTHLDTPQTSVNNQDFDELSNPYILGNTNLATHYNVYNGYLRVMVDNNALLDSPGGATVASDLANITSSFSIHRMNYLEEWGDDPDQELLRQAYGTGYSSSLNTTRTAIQYVFDFTSAANGIGYRFTFDAVNMSYRVITFVDFTEEWTDVSVTSTTTVNGVPHYLYDLEFGTSELTNFAIVVIFDVSGIDDGSFSTSLTSIIPQQIQGIDIGTLNTQEYDLAGAPSSGGPFSGDLLSNPFVIGGIAAAAVGIIGAIVYYLRSRGKLPFSS